MEKDPRHASKAKTGKVLPSMQMDGRLLLDERSRSEIEGARVLQELEQAF